MPDFFSFHPSNITDRQIKNLYDQASFAIIGNVGVAILLVGLLWDIAGHYVLSVWLGLMVFVNLLRSVLLLRYRRSPQKSSSMNGLIQLHIVVAVTGILWGISSFISMQLDDSVYQILSLLVLSGIVGASIATLGSLFSCYLVFILPTMLPMTLWLLFQNNFLLIGTGLLSAFYIIVIVRASHRFGKALQLSYELTEEQIRLADRLDEANRSKSEFLAKMSHEIRTPMNGVLGMAEVLSTTELTQQQQGFLNTISSSGSALLAVMNDILDFSRMQHGSFELHESRFNLEDLCNEATSIFVASIREKKLNLVIDISSSIPLELDGDAARIRQIIVNLISNAIKSTNEGFIILRVIFYGYSNGNLVLKFEIEDSGIGIQADKQRQLFKPYVQTDQATDGITGSGLGLSICSELVALMDGDIGIESSPGSGSTFWFTVQFKGHADTWVANYPAGQEDEHLRVILVEPDVTYAHILMAYLKAARVYVELLSGVRELSEKLAIATKADTEYDLVLFSNIQDEFDRTEFFSTIHQYQQHADLKLLLCMQDNIQMKDTQMGVKIDGFINKPVTPIRLNDVVNDIFNDSEINDVRSEQSSVAQSPRVLVAEDDIVSQQVVSELLKALGCDVQMVDNGNEVLDKMKNDQFDLLFLDGQLPGLTGWQVSSAIREFEKQNDLSRLPIIILSAYSLDVVHDKVKAGIIDDYLAKPIDYERIEATVGNYITMNNIVS